jgi:hypothetical protein
MVHFVRAYATSYWRLRLNTMGGWIRFICDLKNWSMSKLRNIDR